MTGSLLFGRMALATQLVALGLGTAACGGLELDDTNVAEEREALELGQPAATMQVLAPIPKLNLLHPGYVSQTNGTYHNRCVPNLPWQVSQGLNNGTASSGACTYGRNLMAYGYSSSVGAPTIDNGGLDHGGWYHDGAKHLQGVARYRNPVNHHNYFYVSYSLTSAWAASQNGGFEVIPWAYRTAAGALGSNVYNETDLPPTTTFRVQGLVRAGVKTDHGGGMQIMGRFLAVPYMANTAFIEIYDLADPVHPAFHHRVYAPHGVNFGWAALSRLGDGRFLLIGGGDTGMEIYISKSTAFPTAGSGWNVYLYKPGGLWDDKPFYQSGQLVTDCDGSLFLMAGHRAGYFWNTSNYYDGYRVTFGTGVNDIKIVKDSTAKRALADWGGEICPGQLPTSTWADFMASVGTYIDPDSGDLIVYSTEHFNDGPEVSGVGSTRMKEFQQD